MKLMMIGVVASLAALFLYPIVLNVGKRVANKMQSLNEDVTQDDDNATN